MAKVTSKYQVTVPRAIAQLYSIRPGDDIDWIAAGDVIRVVPSTRRATPEDRDSKLSLFDQATERHRRRPSASKAKRPRSRGWAREDLYRRGRSH
ncbi:MAG: AbrB/MazE/SpoVT family DNA-binding domain-containing protein [Bryobacteraceae bacterium]|jgi:bifunctional DNA-binding transcriptional regulator/antitoxin component of YhaV-PrlF toxin-antitoxin module